MEDLTSLGDAHVHFNLKSANPVMDLVDYLERFNIEPYMLIINEAEEYRVFRDFIHTDKFDANSVVAFGLNKSTPFAFEAQKFCVAQGILFALKLHPRLYHIKEADMPWYLEQIQKLNPRIIIVDDFDYGCDVSEETVLELIYRLAKNTNNNIVVAHAGGIHLLKHVMKTKVLPNVYYDISLTINYLFASSIYRDLSWLMKFMADRVLLGSDYPDFTLAQAFANFSEAAEEYNLPIQAVQRICRDNLLQLFKLGKGE